MKALRIIVCPHELAMGGSQINAIELAARLKSRGHQVLLFAPAGELSARVAELDLEHVVSPAGTRLSLRWMLALRRQAREWNADLVHTYEWAPSMGAACGSYPFSDVRMVMTVLSMDVPDFLPRHVPLIVGTEDLRQRTVRRSAPIYLMEPTIDTQHNSQEALTTNREMYRIGDELVISMVCRMTDDLDKASGVIQAIKAVEQLDRKQRACLIVAGDGEAMTKVRARADDVNLNAGREVVKLLGNLTDPRAVYAESDLSLGMGSSALKALSFGKPLIVQGAAGFWKTLTPGTLNEFSLQGFYGHGGSGIDALTAAMEELCASGTYRKQLGSWGRKLVEEQFSLDAATESLEGIYQKTLDVRTSSRAGVLAMTRSAFDYCKFLFATNIRTRVAP